MNSSPDNSNPPGSSSSLTRLRRATQVIVVSSVMFTFISYWRTAAVVLCDLASTAYYIGGIVEQAIGPAAPWFILAVMLFSYAVRSVYIESCSLFVRGGVYRVVKEAMGGFLAKLVRLRPDVRLHPHRARSAASRPASTSSACCSRRRLLRDIGHSDRGRRDRRLDASGWGSVVIACAITLYFFRQNLHRHPRIERQGPEDHDRHHGHGRGHHRLVRRHAGRAAGAGPLRRRRRQHRARSSRSIDPAASTRTPAQTEDPLGFLSEHRRSAEQHPQHCTDRNWLSLLGLIGLFIAFGHSILAMSGEETLAQVYREVESPKLLNFKKAAFIVFVYSLVLTGRHQLPGRAAHPRRRAHGEVLATT